MSTQAACMLIPLGVVLYVIVGGLRATLVADYIHVRQDASSPCERSPFLLTHQVPVQTTFLYSIILTFMFTIYAVSEKIGSPARVSAAFVALTTPLTIVLPRCTSSCKRLPSAHPWPEMRMGRTSPCDPREA